MTEAKSALPEDVPPKLDPESLVLRGRPRPVVRFRRGLIIGIAAILGVTLVSIAWFALEPPSFRQAAPGSGDQAGIRSSDETLARLPKDYGDAPKLGPPLPGDLGRPILERQRSLADAPAGHAALADDGRQAREAALEAERQRTIAAEVAARSSGLIVQLAGRPAEQASAAAPTVAPASEDSRASAASEGQQQKAEFARRRQGDGQNASLTAASSPWTLSAGTIISASLITGLNSDLPGMVFAQVTENVRDSATGETILIPQGSRLIGNYDNAVSYGQRRALLVWKRIMLPNGASINLDNMPASDSAGYSGLEDKVDFHSWRLLKGIAMSTLLGVGTELSLGGGGALVRAVREAGQQNAARAGDQITLRNLDVQPTIRIRPGWPVRAIVNQDLILAPWRE